MIDIIANLDRIPGPGETLVARSSLMGFGGKGANQAVMASLLGATVAMVNCVGGDTFGQLTLANFDELGIDRRYVKQITGPSTGVASIWIDGTGENRIAITPGANSEMTTRLVDMAFDGLPLPDSVICQLEIPQGVVSRAFARARQVGAITILNPAPAAPIDSRILENTTWLIPNETEFEAIATMSLGSSYCPTDLASSVARLSSLYGFNVAVTLGRRGVLLFEPAYGPDAVAIETAAAVAADTTGAGDAFVGSFAYGLGRGLSGADAARLACHCAASSVARMGTQISFPRGPQLAGITAQLDLGVPASATTRSVSVVADSRPSDAPAPTGVGDLRPPRLQGGVPPTIA